MKEKKEKKRKKVEKKKRGLEQLGSYSVGQYIYCSRVPDKALARGFILHLFKTAENEFAEIVDEISGQFRATLLEDIIDNPTRSQINSANGKIASKIKRSKDKK